jgi:hypothetical protein
VPGIPFLFLGGVIFLIGGIIALTGLKNLARRKRILATPTSPVRQARGGPVEIKGRIVPSEQGVLMAPFSGRHAVWTRVTVEERRSRGRSSYWATIINESDGRSFFVDDGSGEVARILPQAANVILERQSVASSGTFRDAPPHLEAFLQSRGVKSTGFFGFNKQMRYQEELLAPGDSLYAIGLSRRDPGPPVNDGYRMAPSSQLVLYAGPAAADELILTNKSEEELVSRLLWRFLIGALFACTGAAFALAGVVMLILESF